MSELLAVLYKKAKGYTVEETQDEYAAGEDGVQRLTKRRVSEKHIPPDLSALKTYLEMTEQQSDYEKLTDEELEAERKRIINTYICSSAYSDEIEETQSQPQANKVPQSK
jgi:hypothetical protein